MADAGSTSITPMRSSPDVSLPPNRRTAVVVAVVGLVGWIPLWGALQRVFTEDRTSRLVLALMLVAVLAMLFVVAPVMIIRFILERRTWVGADEVRWMRGTHVERRIRFADLTSVHCVATGGLLRGSQRSVTLIGNDPDGNPEQIHVTRTLVSRLQPLVDRVAHEVTRRPQLVAQDEREAFADLVRSER